MWESASADSAAPTAVDPVRAEAPPPSVDEARAAWEAPVVEEDAGEEDAFVEEPPERLRLEDDDLALSGAAAGEEDELEEELEITPLRAEDEEEDEDLLDEDEDEGALEHDAVMAEDELLEDEDARPALAIRAEADELDPDEDEKPAELDEAAALWAAPDEVEEEELALDEPESDVPRPAPPASPTVKPPRRGKAAAAAKVQTGLFDEARPEPEPEVVVTPAPPKHAAARDPQPVAKKLPDGLEDLVFEAGCLLLDENRVAVSMLQRRFGLDFDRATLVLDALQQRGLIGPYLGGKTRDILMSREEWTAHAPGV